MVNGKRVIEPSSKVAVQRFNKSFELLEPLPEKAKKILAVLGADGVASEAVRIANCVKSNVSYWKDRFIKAGALRLKQDGIVKYYELTPYGSRLLTGSDGELRLPIVFEDHALKFVVLRRERCRVDWEKLGEPRNWRKLGVLIGNVRVELNLGLEPSVIIHPGQVKGFNVDELEMESARIVERTRLVLEQNLGMVLSENGVQLHPPRWRVYRPECHQWISAGTVEVEGIGALDHSPTHDKKDPLSGRPHLEYSDKRLASRAAEFPVAHDSNKRLAVSAVEFPVVLANLEAKLDALYGQFERLAAANERLTDMMLGRVADLEKPDSVEVVEGQKELGDYVR
ncbi:MAG: hypothetical protein IAX22_07710 [Candidatus Bathyarchaeota archaeon]|nr:hypothetical protein [Candidatus Bathyarchaeota archaeon]